jgi:hypothetical protein
VNVTELDVYYSGLLKGTTRLLQGLAPMLTNGSHATRVVLLEDAESMLNRPGCGARCVVSGALHTAFAQLRKELTHASTGATATSMTVLKTGSGAAATPADLLSAAIWAALTPIIYPSEQLTWPESFQVAFTAASHETVLKARSRGGDGGGEVVVPVEATVSGTRQDDKLSLDIGCYVSSSAFVKKWVLHVDKTADAGALCPYRFRVTVPYAVFHILYHKLGAVFGSIQDALLLMIE